MSGYPSSSASPTIAITALLGLARWCRQYGQQQRWLAERGPKPRYIDPDCPWQNPYGESFNGRLRDECRNRELFANRHEAAVVLEAWRREYNEDRPHSSLGYRTPQEFRAAWSRGGIPNLGATERGPARRP